jgi:putative transposase
LRQREELLGRVVDLDEHDESAWAIGQARLKIVSALAAQPRANKDVVAAAAWELGVSRAYCYRLLRRFRDSPTASALTPRRVGRGTGAKLLPLAVEQIIEAAIDDYWLKPERPPLAALVREVELRCARSQFAAPTYKAVRARVQARDLRQKLRQREGPARARAKTDRVAGHLAADSPMALVQIDHTLVDVIVVAENSRLPIGRPWLTLAIDIATRMVAGFYLSLDPPSVLAVAMVLSHSALSKDRYLRSRGVKLDWPVFGIPERIHLDNAKEFHSRALARGAEQYGIDIDYRPPAQPHWGGHIERLIGTMMGAVHLVPGSTSSNVIERGDYDAEAAAIMTMSELETWLVHQIAGVYHHTVHRGLGKAPITAWKDAIAESRRPLRAVPDEDGFYLEFLPYQRRTIQRGGISLFNINYSDGVISTFLAKRNESFTVRYDPRDMSTVYLRDPDGTYWPIPYSDRRLPAVTLSEINMARRRLLDAGHKRLTQGQLFEALDHQRELIKSAAKRSKAARRERERLHEARQSQRGKQAPIHRSSDTTGDEAQMDVGPILPYAVEDWS